MSLIAIVFTILFLAVLLWGGDALLGLLPGNEPLKRIVRIIVIVIVALWALSLIASLFGVSLPWNTRLR